MSLMFFISPETNQKEHFKTSTKIVLPTHEEQRDGGEPCTRNNPTHPALIWQRHSYRGGLPFTRSKEQNELTSSLFQNVLIGDPHPFCLVVLSVHRRLSSHPHAACFENVCMHG
jgi:hypothetical protein